MATESPLDDRLRDAAHYVCPREDFRASILEAVRGEVDRKHRRWRWFFSVTVASAVMTMALIVGSLSLPLVPRGRTADELLTQANRQAHLARNGSTVGISESGTRLQWALSEVFADWRRSQPVDQP